ncbi:MAG: TonB-dependent receptor [Elusimicrobiales bacterium]|nr:TonB-dependent receptor [Elusimicrobiales bacterium]
MTDTPKWRAAIIAAALLPAIASSSPAQDPSVYLSLTGAGKNLPAAQQPVGTESVSNREVELKNPASAGEILEEIPEITVIRGGAPGLMELPRMRGFSSADTAVLINGRRLAPDITGTADISLINPAAIERVQAYSGPASPLYGADSQGGAINIVTLAPGGPARAEYQGSVSDFKTRNNFISAKGQAGIAGFAFSGGKRTSAGFQQNGDYSASDLSGAAVLSPNGLGSLRLEASQMELANGIPGGTPVPISQWDGVKERQANSLTDRQDSVRRLYAASYLSPKDAFFTFGADAWVSENNVNAFQYGATTDINTRLSAARASAGFGKFAALTAGVEHNKLTSDDYGNHILETRYAAGETRFALASELEAVAGARYDNAGLWPEQFSPRGVLVWRPLAQWKFSLTAGRAWRAPTFADMFNPWAPANPDLRPEHSWQYEAGAQLETLSGFCASATVFYAALKDKIALDPNNGYAAYNLDEGRNTGGTVEARLKGGSWRHRLGYSYIYSEGKKPGQGWQLSPFNPLHRVNYSGELDLSGRVALGVFARYVSEQYAAFDRAGIKLPDYIVADASLRYAADMFALTFSVNNIGDRHYAENADMFNGYYPLPGRTFRLGFSARIGG